MKIVDLVNKYQRVQPNLVEKLELLCTNITTSSDQTYNLLSKEFLTSEENIIFTKFGSGPLCYTGQGVQNFTKFCGSRTLNNKQSYLIHSKKNESSMLLNGILKKNSHNLVDCKISSSEAVMGIQLKTAPFNQNSLQEFVSLNSNIRRIHLSLTSSNILEIGKPTSSKSLQIFFGKTTENETLLVIFSKFKETTSKSLKLFDSSNLGLEDLHSLLIREFFHKFNDSEFKTLVLDFIRSNFFIPSQESLTQRSQGTKPNTKMKYLQSGFNTALKYLSDSNLKKDVILLVDNFISEYEVKKSQ
jgi:hypothetical protein